MRASCANQISYTVKKFAEAIHLLRVSNSLPSYSSVDRLSINPSFTLKRNPLHCNGIASPLSINNRFIGEMNVNHVRKFSGRLSACVHRFSLLAILCVAGAAGALAQTTTPPAAPEQPLSADDVSW